MAASHVHRFLWITGIVFVLFPHINLGLLSDYKICGDSECESLVSRVQAIRDHHGKDCRFLSFRRGDTIFVYHKLTGKREDLWAGTIDKQFGYFPKDAVQEEQVYATMGKVLETQRSDFFCMDEFGYPTDSSDLDSDDENDDQKIQIQESEPTQTIPYTDDTDAESPSASTDPYTGAPVSAQQPDGTTTEGDENNNAGDAAARTSEEAHENDQGGSPPSSWLGSSVTGWLGLGKEEESWTLAEEEKEDERKEAQAKTSLTSSVTGWLGFGGEGKPDDVDVKSREDDKETDASFTSTMTGWLGIGGETKTDPAKNEQDAEREIAEENEPEVQFRSRRMSLDLEGSQLHEEEKKETGTLDWLGNGLSHTLGFGTTNQESGHETSGGREAEETIEEEKEQSASGSWFGIGDILGFRKDEREGDESTGSGVKEPDEDKTLEEETGSENADASQTRPAWTQEEKLETETIREVEDDGISSSSNKNTNESDVEEQEQVPQSETEAATSAPVEDESNNDNTDASDGRMDNVSPVDQKDIPPLSKLEEKSQAVGAVSSMIDEDRSAEMEAVLLTQSDTNLGPELISVDSNAGSAGKSVGKIEEDVKDQLQSGDEEGAKLVTAETGASGGDHEGAGSDEETDVPSTSQTHESAEQSQGSVNADESGGKTSSFLPPGTTEEGNEAVHGEDGSLNARSVNAVDDNNTETGTRDGELGGQGEVQPGEGSAQESGLFHSTNRSTESLYAKASEGGTSSSSTTQMENNGDQEPDSESDLKAAIGSEKETEAGEDEESKEEEQVGKMEVKQRGKQDELKEVEEIQENERRQEVEVETQDEAEEFMGKEQRQEAKEMQEQGKQEEAEELKEEEKQELKEVEEIREEERQEEMEEIEGKEKEEGKQEKVEELEEDEKKEEKDGEENQIRSSHLEVQTEDIQKDISRPESESSEKEIGDENAKAETPQTEEEKREMEKKKQEKVEEEKKEDEEMQQVNDVEDDRRDREEEESLKCPHAADDESARDGDEKIPEDESSSADEETIRTGNANDQILPDRTGEIQTVSGEGDRIGQEEDGLEVDQTEDNDLPGENGHPGLPEETLLGQTAEDRGDGQLHSGEAKSSDPSDDHMQHQGENTKPEDTETGSNGVSPETKHEQIDSNHKTEEGIEVRSSENADWQMKNNDDNTTGREPPREEGWELSAPPNESVESQAVISEQPVPHVSKDPTGSSLLSDDGSRTTAETEHGGAFGLFKNTFSFFGHTQKTQTKGSVDSAPSLETNTGETPQPQVSQTPEQDLDPTTDSGQVYNKQHLQTDSPVTTPTGQPQHSPSSAEIQTPTPSTPSPNTETPLQTKTLSKDSKNLLAHMSADEATVLMELFGRHKLQFLDYMLGSSDTVPEDPDNDESILSDIERLLHYHRETLVAPSMRLADAPQEDKEKTRALIALQKLEMLITRLRETFNTGKSDSSNHQAGASCVGASCSTHSKDQEMTTDEDASKTEDPSVALDDNIQTGERMDVENDGQRGGKERETADEKKEEHDEESVPPAYRHLNQPRSPLPLEGVMKQILDFVHQIAEESATHIQAVRELLIWITVQVVSSLPDDIRPGPDLYGVPWEPVIISSLVGLVTMLLFTCRCYSSVKSRMYRSKERWMAQQVGQLLEEKCKVLETLSKCQQEYDDLEDSLRDSGVLAQTQKTENLEAKARQLEHAKRELERDLEQLKGQLDHQKQHRIEQERRIAVLEESMKTFEEETKDLQSQDKQAQTTLKVYSMNSDRLQRNLETAGEENTLLKESNAQLRQQVEGWAERVSELEAEMRRCEVAYSGMQQDVANKDERIMSLTDRLLRMKAWDSDLEEEEGGEGAEKETSNGATGKEGENGRGDITDTQAHFHKVQKLIYAAKLNADLKSVDEDKDRVFAKLNDEVKAKEDLQVSIKEMENEKLSLQSDAEHYSDQVQRLQQKLQIMTEMYQENELKLHRLLTVEEKERLQKEEKLHKADKNIALAMEELNNYRQRAEEMEEELEKSKQSYQTQISAHEKKAHNNWLAARAADRELADIRRENALLRQKLTDTQFKLDTLDKDPYALDSLARPLPFRAERSPYGPSPLGRPASETRAFLSPPTLMDGPPARLSPRVGRGPMEPPGGQGEMERSGGPHSDSGSSSPTWERDRRGPPPGPPGPPGPLGPPGYMFPEPGGPMYRRPPPPPGGLGLLPPPGSLPPGPPLPHPRVFPPAGPPGPPHPADMSEGPYRENSLGPGEQEHRESGPGDRRTPPEADPRMGGPPPPGPPMGPMDGPFPRRAPYGPPPPDFYPPRGPGGPPMMPMWAPPPPGMMFPPRFPPGGPALPPAPHPHYAPPMRPLPPDGLPPPSMGPPPPQQSLPSPPHSQSPEEHRPSPEDAI